AALLDDGIAIRDLVRILEAIGERARTNRAADALVEAARVALGPAISAGLAVGGVLRVATIDPRFEHQLASHAEVTEEGAVLQLDVPTHDLLTHELARVAEAAAVHGAPAVVVCSAGLRPALGRSVRMAAPATARLSYPEVCAHLSVDIVASIAADPSSPTSSPPEPTDAHAAA